MLLEVAGFDFDNDEVIFAPTMEKMMLLPNLLQRLSPGINKLPASYFKDGFPGMSRLIHGIATAQNEYFKLKKHRSPRRRSYWYSLKIVRVIPQ